MHDVPQRLLLFLRRGRKNAIKLIGEILKTISRNVLKNGRNCDKIDNIYKTLRTLGSKSRRGYSGLTEQSGAGLPAEREYKAGLVVNWLGISEAQARATLAGLATASPNKFIANTPPEGIPERLWKYLVRRCGLRDDLRWAELGSKGLNRLVGRLTADEYRIDGRARFKEEFVTCGGVALSGIDLQTQQSKLYPGLYFAGEVLDVDAVTGGFNLQAAWSMGWRVARKTVAYEKKL